MASIDWSKLKIGMLGGDKIYGLADNQALFGAASAPGPAFKSMKSVVDFALGLTAVVLDLPQGAAFAIFLVARSVGWVAHAIEQYGRRQRRFGGL